MTVDQAYRVFLSLLEVQGYSVSDIDGVLRIYPSALAKITPRAVVADFAKMDTGGHVTHVVTPKNGSTAAIAHITKPLTSPTGYVAPREASAAVVIADGADNVKQIVELVQRPDGGGSLDMDIVNLASASAKDVAQVRSGLAKTSGGNGEAGTATSSSSL